MFCPVKYKIDDKRKSKGQLRPGLPNTEGKQTKIRNITIQQWQWPPRTEPEHSLGRCQSTTYRTILLQEKNKKFHRIIQTSHKCKQRRCVSVRKNLEILIKIKSTKFKLSRGRNDPTSEMQAVFGERYLPNFQ